MDLMGEDIRYLEEIMSKNKHIGSSFDELLKEEGTLEATELAAIKKVIAEQVKIRKFEDHYDDYHDSFKEIKLSDYKFPLIVSRVKEISKKTSLIGPTLKSIRNKED